MSAIQAKDLPRASLLSPYQAAGAYTDCYSTVVPRQVSLADFVEAFYNSIVFRPERWILRWAVNRPSNNAQARQLADGLLDRYAAWTVEARAPDQVLLCDLTHRTRSWLMVERMAAEPPETRLYFGSAVVPKRDPVTGKSDSDWHFRALMGFHRAYSQMLLTGAASSLRRRE